MVVDHIVDPMHSLHYCHQGIFVHRSTSLLLIKEAQNDSEVQDCQFHLGLCNILISSFMTPFVPYQVSHEQLDEV